MLLRGNVEIDEAKTTDLIEELKTEIPDFETWLVQIGILSEAALLRTLELEDMRIAAISHLINITDDEIKDAFDEWVGDDDTLDIEDFHESIYDFLYAEAVEELLFVELARLRAESGLEIFNEQLESAYEDYLGMITTEITPNPATTPSSPEVIARINGIDITMGQLFDASMLDIGLEIALTILEAEIIGGVSIEEILEPTEERLKEIYENILASEQDKYERLHNEVDDFGGGSHILVSDYDFALELIEQLKEADDFGALFAELAHSYSNCPSGERSKGDLGAWNRGQMVEPFDEAFFELELGDFTTSPVETTHGYHIIYRPIPTLDDIPEFEDIREDLKSSEISNQMQNQALMNSIFIGLIEEADITFTNPALQIRFKFFMDI